MLAELRRSISVAAEAIALVCRTIAVVDVSASLAFAARRYGLTRPVVTPPGEASLVAYGVRHLVVERALLEGWAEAFPWAADAGAGADPADLGDVAGSAFAAVSESEYSDRSLPSPPAPPRSFIVNDIILGAPSSAADVASARQTFERSTTHPQDAAALLASRSVILCGANANGKSTYLRSAAHLVILAQLGSFVPAAYARLSVADRLMARVGASDDVSRSRSTFLLEMEETAAILVSVAELRGQLPATLSHAPAYRPPLQRHATQSSLVLIDEVGRGTAMADGLAIACAVAEHLTHVGCRLLFATHIHELTALAMAPRTAEPLVRCMVMDVQLAGGVPVLTHRVVLHPVHLLTSAQIATLLNMGLPPPTLADPVSDQASLEAWQRVLGTSHGVHIAAAAGLPAPVVARARSILTLLDQTYAASAWARAVAQVTVARPVKKTDDNN